MSNNKQNAQTLTHKDTHIAAFWKSVEYVGLILFLAVIPRSMGPEMYGDFAVILSLLGLFLLAGALGGLAVFGRLAPKYYADDQPEKVDGMFTQFFVFRLVIALPVMVLLPVVLTLLRPEIAFDIAIAVAIAYFSNTVSMACFQLFFGLNRMGMWLFHDSSSRVLLIAMLFIFWGEIDLKNAVYSLAFIEVVLAGFLLFFSRKYFDLKSAINQLPEFVSRLKFGLAFFAANLLLMVIWRSGEIMVVSFTGETEQVAFYNLSNSIFLALYALFSQIGSILIPSVSSMHSSGQHERKEKWLGLMTKYLTVATLLALIVINAIGEPILTLLLGQGYSEVAVNLYIITISLVPLNIVSLGFVAAVVHGQLRGTFIMTSLALVTFILSAVLLAPELGAKGVSISVVMSGFVGAAFGYWYFRLSTILAKADFWKIVALGVAFLGLIKFSGYSPVITGVLSLLAYVGLLLMFRIVRISELLALVQGKNSKATADTTL